MAREIEIYSTSRFQSGNSRFLCMQYYEHEHLGDLLIVGSEDKAIRVYEVKSGNCLITLLGHKNRTYQLFNQYRQIIVRLLHYYHPSLLMVSLTYGTLIKCYHTITKKGIIRFSIYRWQHMIQKVG
ncbi:hypothetical protein GLOIN_2v431117 [Rhizophagus irregularis DAOM 181602=DAOM 197198]|uniref:Uncharacterized protein n=1 Tax=Rhizophagus irregularis (strain DAOM 181602 / DAOM 197198 / MUCL 43194) TaxID=747089 RepID=A0A2P4PIQ5_RHIID|nr:hypothetical protein GLOIN_2v431117 [Rhizophagus irregularis DAOM 181602=DAOM 197198]POG65264.1 hypothetical protein GLOIN_2v431117 [Rhizophagus irregularis DAOM 181602=DAOM 197198]|eukprot:XP_025172130.1 hypothetical protein GLOIN_2v431117 [Rhizophagus irregularis DAOM 181602=DAOM 197198]